MWVEAAAFEPAGDAALQSFHDEGVQVLRSHFQWDATRHGHLHRPPEHWTGVERSIPHCP